MICDGPGQTKNLKKMSLVMKSETSKKIGRFGGGFAFITDLIFRTKDRRVKRRAYFSRLSVRHRLRLNLEKDSQLSKMNPDNEAVIFLTERA